jgi:hypothetical protein
MRTSLILLAASLCVGCDRAARETSERVEPVSSEKVDAVVPKKVEPETAKVEAATADRPAEPEVKATTHVEPAPVPVPPAMTKEEIAELVRSTVAEELARQSRASAGANAKDAAEEVRAAAEKAELEARAAAEKQATEAARAAQREDETVARVLLLPSELDHVERLRKRLQTESIWGLTLQDLDFASEGLAAPLLRNELYAAAERHDSNIELDVLAQKARLTPDEKIEMATMPPIERQQLLSFAERLEKGEKTAAADRYMREYVVRYPFVRKLLVELVRSDPQKR